VIQKCLSPRVLTLGALLAAISVPSPSVAHAARSVVHGSAPVGQSAHSQTTLATSAAPTSPAAIVTGPSEVVYDYATSACASDDVPDLPVRGLRSPSGQVSLMMPNWTNRELTGPSFDDLSHPCSVTSASAYNADPSAFADRQWVASPYTTDGTHLFALVHDEYQGSTHPGECPSGVYQQCWYNALTLATSSNGGATWSAPAGRLVAAVPYKYVPDGGPEGYMEPSNIVRSPTDRYYYATFLAMAEGAQARGTCVMRTSNLADPTSWRAWNGRSFSVSFIDPYTSTASPATHVCQPLPYADVGEMTQSLTYSTFFNKFMLVGESQAPGPDGALVSGVYFSLSSDMVHWTTRQLLLPTQFPWDYTCPAASALSYPSIIDPSSSSPTFQTVGQTAYLYLTRFNYLGCDMTWDRDLVRYPVTFTH